MGLVGDTWEGREFHRAACGLLLYLHNRQLDTKHTRVHTWYLDVCNTAVCGTTVLYSYMKPYTVLSAEC